MAISTIQHDPDLPWGWWMRTVGIPGSGAAIVDEHGTQWSSLRDAFWRGRLNMPDHNERIVTENLELMLALLASRSKGIVPVVESRATLFGGNDHFYRWWTYWLISTGLTHSAFIDPFDAVPTAEGASVIKMLIATRPPELAAIPIGRLAMETFGPPGSSTECRRDRFETQEGKARSLVFCMVREQLAGQPVISMLHRDLNDMIPLARTIWNLPFHDKESRDRTFSWMHDRLDRWTSWGALVLHRGAKELTQELFALMMLSQDFQGRPGVDPGSRAIESPFRT